MLKIFLCLILYFPVLANPLQMISLNASKVETLVAPDGYSALEVWIDGDTKVRVMAGTRPYYESVLPDSRDLYLGFGDGLIRQAVHLDDEGSGIDRSRLRAREPLVFETGNLKVAYGEYLFLPKAEDSRRLWVMTFMDRAWPVYLSLRSTEPVSEAGVLKVLKGLKWPLVGE